MSFAAQQHRMHEHAVWRAVFVGPGCSRQPSRRQHLAWRAMGGRRVLPCGFEAMLTIWRSQQTQGAVFRACVHALDLCLQRSRCVSV